MEGNLENPLDNLEKLWEELLSENPGRIRRVWRDLTDDEAQSALTHLQEMTTGDLWQPEQRQAAATALSVIREQAE